VGGSCPLLLKARVSEELAAMFTAVWTLDLQVGKNALTEKAQWMDSGLSEVLGIPNTTMSLF
jgi:hypothetical protein